MQAQPAFFLDRDRGNEGRFKAFIWLRAYRYPMKKKKQRKTAFSLAVFVVLASFWRRCGVVLWRLAAVLGTSQGTWQPGSESSGHLAAWLREQGTWQPGSERRAPGSLAPRAQGTWQPGSESSGHLAAWLRAQGTWQPGSESSGHLCISVLRAGLNARLKYWDLHCTRWAQRSTQ